MQILSSSLHTYELVLLILGVVLFLILCAALIYFVIKKEPIKKLLLFFAISIVMIGYPSIQEIQIENNKISLTKYSEDLQDNPDDEEIRKKLQELVAEMKSRAYSSEDIESISRAYLLLEDPESAIDFANKAITAKKDELGEDTKPNSNGGIEEMADGKISESATSGKEFQSLNDIIKLASIQQQIKNHPAEEIDTLSIKNKIMEVESIDAKTKEYLKTRYVGKKPSN